MRIFAIMPFADIFNDVYTTIKNCSSHVVRNDCYCRRLAEIADHGRITDMLLRELKICDLCIADITNNNANVMYEVGFAMALNKRIIFLSQNLSSLPFDIKDMKTYSYDRNSLTSSLKTNLTNAFDYEYKLFKNASLNVYPDKKKANDDSNSEIKTYQLDNTRFQRGSFTNFLVDATLSSDSSMNPINIHNDLLDRLTNALAEIDLKYHYLGITGATNWLRLSQHPEYEHSELKNTIFESISEIISILASCEKMIDIVGLGPGDGEIDLKIINESIKKNICNYYYGIDISFELLQKTFSNISSNEYLMDKIKMKAIHGDFNYLARYKPIYMHYDTRNLFSLLGYTLGNHQEAQLLGNIRTGMENRDFLLLDARLHNEKTSIGNSFDSKLSKDILEKYSHAINNRFAFSPLELVSSLKYEDIKDKFKVSLRHNRTVVPNAVNIITTLHIPDKKKINITKNGRKINRQKFDLASTTVYDFESLKDFLCQREFDVVWSKRKNNIGLFLLKKNDDSS